MNALGQAFFWACALCSLCGALLTVISRNPIRSAMSLLLTVVGITGLFLALHAQFLATTQLIVYAGAIVILFVFVIMLMGPDANSPQDSKAIVSRVIASVVFGLGAAFIAAYLMSSGGGMHAFPDPHAEQGSIEVFGNELFTRGLVPFELASALFIVAIIGAIALARGNHKPASSPADADLSKQQAIADKPATTHGEHV